MASQYSSKHRASEQKMKWDCTMSAATPNVDTGGLILINSYFIQQTFISLHLLCFIVVWIYFCAVQTS